MAKRLMCKKPDRDTPELVCGYPLPCPWHTVTIDLKATPAAITIPVTNPAAARPEVLSVLKEIARSLDEKSIRKQKG